MHKTDFYLKKGLEELGITPSMIIDDLNFAQSYVSRILNGNKPIGSKTALRLAETYGLNLDWILTGKGDPKENNQKVISEIEDINEVAFENLKIDDKINEIYKLTLGKLSIQEKDIMLLDRKVDVLRRENEIIIDLNKTMLSEITELKTLIQELINH